MLRSRAMRTGPEPETASRRAVSVYHVRRRRTGFPTCLAAPVGECDAIGKHEPTPSPSAATTRRRPAPGSARLLAGRTELGPRLIRDRSGRGVRSEPRSVQHVVRAPRSDSADRDGGISVAVDCPRSNGLDDRVDGLDLGARSVLRPIGLAAARNRAGARFQARRPPWAGASAAGGESGRSLAASRAGAPETPSGFSRWNSSSASSRPSTNRSHGASTAGTAPATPRPARPTAPPSSPDRRRRARGDESPWPTEIPVPAGSADATPPTRPSRDSSSSPETAIVSVSTVATSGSDDSFSDTSWATVFGDGGAANGRTRPTSRCRGRAPPARPTRGPPSPRRTGPGRRSTPRRPAPSGRAGSARSAADIRLRPSGPSFEQRQHAIAGVADHQVLEAAAGAEREGRVRIDAAGRDRAGHRIRALEVGDQRQVVRPGVDRHQVGLAVEVADEGRAGIGADGEGSRIRGR